MSSGTEAHYSCPPGEADSSAEQLGGRESLASQMPET